MRFLTACGDDAGSASAGPAPVGDPDGFVVVQRFPNSKALVPGDVRLPIALAAADGMLLTDGPATLTGVVRDGSGATIATIDTPRRGDGLGVPYWTIEATVPTPGLYEFALDGAAGEPTPFLVWTADETTVPAPGQALAPFDTPTVDDPRGVDPICTRLDGTCPFHEVTLTEALDGGRPVVYLVGTPAHCTTGTCAPGLDFLVAAAPQYADRATFVHADVYADAAATRVAPAVAALGIDYEPAVFVTDATGTIVRRIDIVWDEAELRSILDAGLSGVS